MLNIQETDIDEAESDHEAREDLNVGWTQDMLK